MNSTSLFIPVCFSPPPPPLPDIIWEQEFFFDGGRRQKGAKEYSPVLSRLFQSSPEFSPEFSSFLQDIFRLL
ncbi:hypothetical protein Phum_PHUM598410 [Pediculus humanus corporis]|uniref:Uncharacterized protein n=1 Tax=Pediculus humanus subsp. corporis TaxID=121224 RepID=E0W2W7_PEDHC|nr:uncharacterized protein Phum_PHUM598410 [Pediculus humanus corporis]EEB19973.1 hypothetical protein Phum_PHUM598410 [Pediculus humanus corporis]